MPVCAKERGLDEESTDFQDITLLKSHIYRWKADDSWKLMSLFWHILM
jgi:hypothetical protein